MKRIFLLNRLLPAPIATSILYTAALAVGIYNVAHGDFPSWTEIGSLVLFVIYSLFVAYVASIIPSIFCAFMMSWVYRRKNPETALAWLYSSLGGMLSGAAIGLPFGGRSEHIGFLAVLGLLTGFILGYIVRRFARKHAHVLKLNLETLP